MRNQFLQKPPENPSHFHVPLKPACSCSKIRGTSGTPTPTPSWVTVRGIYSMPAAPPRTVERSSSAAAAVAARRSFYSRGTHSVSGQTGHAAAVRHLPRILSRYDQPKQLTWGHITGCWPGSTPPAPSKPVTAGRNHLNKWITPLLPTEIDEWYSQTISIKGQAVHRYCIGKKSHPEHSWEDIFSDRAHGHRKVGDLEPFRRGSAEPGAGAGA